MFEESYFKDKYDFIKRVKVFFYENECLELYKHSIKVAKKAEELCETYGLDKEIGFICGMLHDIGGIYPNRERIKVAEDFKIKILEEEKEFPLIIHQKISKKLAEIVFKIENKEILNAIECHTTLRKDYSTIDMILFLADKIEWDRNGKPPYIEMLLEKLSDSLEDACLYYINFIIKWDIKVLHPWLKEAKKSLEDNISKDIKIIIGPQSIVQIKKVYDKKFMKKIKKFFDKHKKLSYLGNFIISLLGIIIFPYLLMPNFNGFILGLILTIIVLKILGLRWEPLFKSKNN